MESWGPKELDPQVYLLGKERPVQDEIMGRHPGDIEKLFPRVSHASPATTGEVTVNGKTLKLWTFAQLETLSVPVLRQRAMAFRDVLGEAACPPLPSAQQQELVRWILHVQGDLTNQPPQTGRNKDLGKGHVVPPSFAQESKDRPIAMTRPKSPMQPRLPFGPRTGHDHDATRDHFSDLKFHRNEFKEAPVQGIQSLRLGGEGRKHLFPKENMVASGVSTAEAHGIQSMKPGGEGRRFIECKDHLFEQKRDLQATAQRPAPSDGASVRALSPRQGGVPVRHVSEAHMCVLGYAEPDVEAPVLGDRKRHLRPQDHMLTQGISIGQTDEDVRAGRKFLDGFDGSRANWRDSHENYQSTWKKEPGTKLRGASMLC